MKNINKPAVIALLGFSVLNFIGLVMIGLDSNHKTSEAFKSMDMLDMKFSRMEKLLNESIKVAQEAQGSGEGRIDTLNENLRSLHQDILTILEPENFKMMVYEGCRPAKPLKK